MKVVDDSDDDGFSPVSILKTVRHNDEAAAVDNSAEPNFSLVEISPGGMNHSASFISRMLWGFLVL